MVRESPEISGSERREWGSFGEGTVVEPGALILQPAHIHLGRNVYVSHLAYLSGDPEGELRIGDGTLVGPHCYLHGAGGLLIGKHVGIGAGVITTTSVHAETGPGSPITDAPLRYGRIEIGDGCDIGVGSILLPGAKLGDGVQVGAGAVLRDEYPAGSVVAGVPARVLRMRGEGDWAAGLAEEPPRQLG